MADISFDDLIPQNAGQPLRGPAVGQDLSFDDLIPQQPQAQQPRQDLGGFANTADAYGRGIANMASFGFADEVGAGARWLGGKVLPWQSNVTYDQALDEVRGSDKALAEAHPYANAAGQVTGAIGSASGLARAGLSPTARAVDAGYGLRGVSAASALEGAAMGAAQGAGQAEGGLSSRLENATYGGVGGGLIGGAIPGVMAMTGGAVRKAISPFVTNPERSAAAAALAREGVETTAGQRTGSNSLRYAESEIGGQRAADMMDRQGEQFTAATLRRAGIDAPRATPEVIDDAFNRIGGQFDQLAARNQLVPDRQIIQDLGDTWREYASMVPESQRAPVVMDMIQDVGTRLGQGPLEGSVYQATRSRLDRMARSSGQDPQLQSALYGLRSTLDDGMERSMAAANPDDVGAWRGARNQYRNMMTIEKAATGAGENAAQGVISPQALRNATVNTQGRRNYARGSGDFGELARSGAAVMQPMPNSGTAGRAAVRSLGVNASLAGAGAAGSGYSSGGDPATMAAGAAAGFFAPRLVGRAMMSGPVQGYLGNQAAAGMAMTPQVQALVNRILGVESSEYAPMLGRGLVGP